MKILRLLVLIAVLLLAGCGRVARRAAAKSSDPKFSLNDGWALQSSAKVSEKGEAIATPAFQPKDWIKANVPDHRRRRTGEERACSPIPFTE